jgi:hypothetical protein
VDIYYGWALNCNANGFTRAHGHMRSIGGVPSMNISYNVRDDKSVWCLVFLEHLIGLGLEKMQMHIYIFIIP